MATTATGRVALFSIKPQYAEAILAGSKEVEFRRTALAADVTHVVIYATSPVQRVLGTFEVAGVEQATPTSLWTSYGRVGGIGLEDYLDYFTGAETAYAIKVRRPQTWTEPLALEALSPGLRAPQSYQYLRDEALARIAPLLLPPARCSVVEHVVSSLGRRLRSRIALLARENETVVARSGN